MSSELLYIAIFFFYGLAFFSMGLLVAMEGGNASDSHLRKALRPLAAFGLIHAGHEWLGMFEYISTSFGVFTCKWLCAFQLGILAFSFVSLAAFGAYLLAKTETAQRVILLVPLGLEAIWVFGLLALRGQYGSEEIWVVADVWTRYALGIPSAVLASVGLIAQQYAFRQAGLVRFGQDALWAAIAFGWYGLVGQMFTQASPLFPSTVLNQDKFLALFGFPVELVRGVTAVAAAMFIIRFMRAFRFEIERRIAILQEARIQEAQERETMRGELFRRTVAAQEAERQRIARDLHDETGQALTALGMGLRGLSTRLPKRNPETTATLRQLESLVAHSLDELQRLISDLRPSHLDDLGLTAALRWYAGTIQDRTSLQIGFEVRGEERPVDSPVKIALFRVAQEALNNIVKHAQASAVDILLSYESSRVRVRVKDDGRGFDVQAARKNMGRTSLGLAGMQERASLLGGQFSLSSKPGGGTLIEVEIPYQFKTQEAGHGSSPAAGG
jgi:signal transduction histidine kinase